MQLDRLESEKKGIRVLNVKSKNDRRHFLVAAPNAEVEYFAKRFREYLTKDNIYGSPKNEPLASGIEEIVAGELADYWTDVEQQTSSATAFVSLWIKHVGLAEAQIERLTSVRMFVQQIPKIGRRMAVCRNGEQHREVSGVLPSSSLPNDEL